MDVEAINHMGQQINKPENRHFWQNIDRAAATFISVACLCIDALKG